MRVRCSPRVRGWTSRGPRHAERGELLPARAGMDPASVVCESGTSAAPRACGDGPTVADKSPVRENCSPRVRGWTRPSQGSRRPQAPAPRACGDGPRNPPPASPMLNCSPRVRGWTLRGHGIDGLGHLLPARAGMDPWGSPRTRSRTSAPRACGDGPSTPMQAALQGVCSPRVRGWTLLREARGERAALLPARAGMDPGTPRASATGRAAPRACGDGPTCRYSALAWKPCSPCGRGWTCQAGRGQGDRRLLPARAGMDLSRWRWSWCSPAAPRACGDGPEVRHFEDGGDSCSPRVRGWTRGVAARGDAAPLLPARAGMDPNSCTFSPPLVAAPRACGDGPSAHSERAP